MLDDTLHEYHQSIKESGMEVATYYKHLMRKQPGDSPKFASSYYCWARAGSSTADPQAAGLRKS